MSPRAALVALGALAVASCSTPQTDPRTIETAPDRASFDAVEPVLVRHCGSLDCHGNVHRNLRLFGSEGMRLDGTRPLDPVTSTAAETDESYASVIGLEPEIMTQVVSQGGASPERLTLVRKARGTEAHKGLSPIQQGDPSDVCITSWLAGKVDTASCANGTPKLYGW